MADKPFIPDVAARALVRSARLGSLGTLATGDGTPFASLVSVATMPDGTPLVLISRLALHTRNAEADARASLLVTDGAIADPLAGARVTLSGRLRPVAGEAVPLARRRFLARHPSAEGYAAFPDFAFWQLDVQTAHLVGGFGRIHALEAADVLIDPTLGNLFVAGEEGAVAHMNADHRDALALYATVLAGAEPGAWIATGIDPCGIDLMTEDRIRAVRVDFPAPATEPGSLRPALVQLARLAREQAEIAA